MKRVSRRAFFELFSPADAPPQEAPAAPAAPRRAREAEASPTTSATGFSLEAFYAARGPQKLPPIAIRPSVLHYASELTEVGCPPPHAPPALENDPLYKRLAEANAPPPRDEDEPSS